MDIYNYISKRKATRDYKQEPLDKEILTKILGYSKEIVQLDDSIMVEMHIAGRDEVKGILIAKAPNYLVLYSESKGDYLANAGFMLEQMDLFLASLGLGSCWLGMAKTKGKFQNKLDYVAMLCFGRAATTPHRVLAEFKRKDLSEISKGEDPRLEDLRLAPSSMNSQPWFYIADSGNFWIYRRKLGTISQRIYDKMNQIDMGIALCFLWLSSEKHNKRFEFRLGKAARTPEIKGYEPYGYLE